MKVSPVRSALGLIVVGAICFALAPIGQDDGGYWESGPSWIGAVGWFGFLISLLLLAATGLSALTRRLMHHSDRSVPH